jgi:hypothetical protein
MLIRMDSDTDFILQIDISVSTIDIVLGQYQL